MPSSLAPSAATTPFTRTTRLARLDDLLRERILVLDGGMGTLVQSYTLTEADFRGDRFREHPRDLRGDTDLI
jgi:5-methyltetrahydrofolate--homocysteine methyltransferase